MVVTSAIFFTSLGMSSSKLSDFLYSSPNIMYLYDFSTPAKLHKHRYFSVICNYSHRVTVISVEYFTIASSNCQLTNRTDNYWNNFCSSMVVLQQVSHWWIMLFCHLVYYSHSCVIGIYLFLTLIYKCLFYNKYSQYVFYIFPTNTSETIL